VGHAAGAFFAVALIDASAIGAMAVTLSTAYAVGDVLLSHHSLHRKPKEAKAFYAVYGGLVVLAAALVLAPGVPLGLLTNAVQALAGVLLPSATVFLLLLCNDHAVLGPWVNGRARIVFTGAVIALLVMLSIILTASVLFPAMSDTTISAILGGGMLFTVLIAVTLLVIRREGRRVCTDSYGRMVWRMPPLDQLPPAQLTPLTRIWLTVLRGYLVIAGGLVFWRILELALSGG
jgi:natural resistance-associated macrophage protein